MINQEDMNQEKEEREEQEVAFQNEKENREKENLSTEDLQQEESQIFSINSILSYIDKAKSFAKFLEDNGAKKIEILDVSKKSKLIKALVIATVLNKDDCKEIAKKIQYISMKNKLDILHVDGLLKGEWIVIDLKDIVIHLFNNMQRQKYNLEKLWKDGKNAILF